MKTLCIGVGNDFRRDDGVGAFIVGALKKVSTDRHDLCFSLSSGEGAELVESWTGYDRVILFDAVRQQGQPGRIYRMLVDRESIPSDFFRYSSHAFSVAEAIELARVLDRLPASMEIIGIEGADFGTGQGLTDAVKYSCFEVIEEISSRFDGRHCSDHTVSKTYQT